MAPREGLSPTTFRALAPGERAALSMLAIHGVLPISWWCDLLQRMGVRESRTRALSTTSLRQTLIAPLTRAALVRQLPDGRFSCAPRERSKIMRWAAAGADFAEMARIARNHGSASAAWSRPWDVDVHLEAWLGIFEKSDAALTQLDEAHRRDRYRAARVAVEVTEPFDQTWLQSLPMTLQARLLELAFGAQEHVPTIEGELYRGVRQNLGLLEGATRPTLLAFAGVAVLHGDLDVLRALLAMPAASEVFPAIRTALAVVEGRYDEAASEAEQIPPPKRADHFGVLSLLSTVALLRRSPNSERAARIVACGGRKGGPLQQTFRIYESVISAGAGRPYRPLRYAQDAQADVLSLLWLALLVRVSADRTFDIVKMANDAAEVARAYGTAGFRWLGEQYAHAAWALYGTLEPKAREQSPDIAKPKGPTATPSLLDSVVSLSKWEIALDRLEALAQRDDVGRKDQPDASATQLLWRCSTPFFELEPILQKRTAGGKWTKGRKLAIKHLMGENATTASLPPEDQRVAKHAREERSQQFGYPVINYAMARPAWLALVGHPRVFLDQKSTPCEVTRGEPKLSVSAVGKRVLVVPEPSGLSKGVSVRKLGEQLVVFDVDAKLHAVVDALGTRFEVPLSGKERLFEVLKRISPMLSVESTEQTSAKTIASDSKPHMQLLPSRGGLSVVMLVRPLGPGGAFVAPGRGAPTLLGQRDGGSIQVARDLPREARLASEVIAALSSLAGAETDDYRWRIDDPESCLALVAELRDIAGKLAVHWPQGTPLRLRARLDRTALRGTLRQSSDFFTLSGSVQIDGELSLELEQLIEPCATYSTESPPRVSRPEPLARACPSERPPSPCSTS